MVEAYLDAVTGLLAPGGPRSVRMAYTPLHGVGADTFLRAVSKAGFDPPAVVADQAEPDPEFPTTPFPNPEEPGVLDRLLRLASDTGADLALAHDPDADRLGVAVPDGGRWRQLTGDETGCLLAEHLLRRSAPQRGAEPRRRRLVINTVVSSRLLPRIAAAHGADWAETPTGFKWIMQARSQRPGHELVLGYEDALGYAVGEAVRDKDGIGAALVMAELVACLKAEGRTLPELLDELHLRHGVHATGQRSIRFEPAPRGVPTPDDAAAPSDEPAPNDEPPMERAMAALRGNPPTKLAGASVTTVHDLASGIGAPATGGRGRSRALRRRGQGDRQAERHRAEDEGLRRGRRRRRRRAAFSPDRGPGPNHGTAGRGRAPSGRSRPTTSGQPKASSIGCIRWGATAALRLSARLLPHRGSEQVRCWGS